MTIRLALPIIAVLTAAAAPAALAGTWMVEAIDGKAPRYSGASVEFGSRSVQATAGCNVNRRANGTPYRRAKGTPCQDGGALM